MAERQRVGNWRTAARRTLVGAAIGVGILAWVGGFLWFTGYGGLHT